MKHQALIRCSSKVIMVIMTLLVTISIIVPGEESCAFAKVLSLTQMDHLRSAMGNYFKGMKLSGGIDVKPIVAKEFQKIFQSTELIEKWERHLPATQMT